MSRPISTETRAKILELRAEGLRQSEISERLGVDEWTVSHYEHAAGVGRYPLPALGACPASHPGRRVRGVCKRCYERVRKAPRRRSFADRATGFAESSIDSDE